MNKVMLIGNLTRDPELRRTASDIAVCTFSIAVSRPFRSAAGEAETDFFNIVVWRAQAENCAKYLKKGLKVAVSGSLQNRSYDGNDGNKRYITEIVASDVEFLTPKNAQGGDTFSSNAVGDLEPIEEEDLPF